jgi:hypothetical protein
MALRGERHEEAALLTGHRSGSRTHRLLGRRRRRRQRRHDDAVMREQSIFCKTDSGRGFGDLPQLIFGSGRGGKRCVHPGPGPTSMPGVSSPYLEVQPGCTGCRVHPGCTKVIATHADQDAEYSRGAELPPWSRSDARLSRCWSRSRLWRPRKSCPRALLPRGPQFRLLGWRQPQHFFLMAYPSFESCRSQSVFALAIGFCCCSGAVRWRPLESRSHLPGVPLHRVRCLSVRSHLLLRVLETLDPPHSLAGYPATRAKLLFPPLVSQL